jgi:4-hydroxy-tetrahydrodipicolinate synthase
MSNKKIIFNGVGVALITPFKNNQVDVGSLTKIVNHLLKNKVDAIVVLGTTGEPPTLSQTEKELIVNTVLKVNNNSSHKAKIILGVGSNSTEHAIELAK